MIPPILATAVLVAALSTPPHVVPQRAPHAVVSQRAQDGLRGTASWFAAPSGTAAAGPALRRLLGAHWRGQRVVVTAGGHAVVVRLTDWCVCRGRVIDLGRDSFARLANPSRGLVTVSVSPGMTDSPVLTEAEVADMLRVKASVVRAMGRRREIVRVPPQRPPTA